MPLAFRQILPLYDYALPPRLIAQEPASPRDSAKLLVWDRAQRRLTDSRFSSIGEFLPRRTVLVLNETKVIAARMIVTRATGGRVSFLLLGRKRGTVNVLANRRPRSREELGLFDGAGFTVIGSKGEGFALRPSFPMEKLDEVLERCGTAPLPPYIKRSPLSAEELKREYQSVFAKHEGSIAAPTASLHFTEALLDELRSRGIRMAKVTLHVHLGTFAPLTEEQWRTGLLHEERYSIDGEAASLLENAYREGDPIIPVGTTALRAIEAASEGNGRIVKPEGTTHLFVREGYEFRLAKGLITNFHVPKSSLMMLVSALVGREELLALYAHAIEREYRFFSFGDAMLIR